MKEATGELNLTLITVVAIAAIGVIFYTLVWPTIKNNIENRTKCSNAVCGTCTGGQAECTYTEGASTSKITCPCKN